MKKLILFACASALASLCHGQPAEPAAPAPPPPAPGQPVEGPNPEFSPPGQQNRQQLPPARPFTTNLPPGHVDKSVPGRPFGSDTGAQRATRGISSEPGTGVAMTNVAGASTNLGGRFPQAAGSAAAMTNQAGALGAPRNVTGQQTGAATSANLQATLSAMQTGTVTTQHRTQLQQAILSAARGAQPPQDLVVRFVDDIAVHLPRARLTQEVQQQFVTAIHSVLANPAQAEAYIVPVRTLLINSGLTPLAAQTIACDLHLLGTSLTAESATIRTGTSITTP